MAVTEQSIMGALQSVIDPNTGKDFVSSKCIKNLQISGDQVRLTLEDGSAYPVTGSLKFSELNVDESTGSVALRATSSALKGRVPS